MNLNSSKVDWLTMPSFHRKKLVKIANTEYVSIPKPWLDAMRKNGELKSTIVNGKEVWYLDMIVNKSITLKIPDRSDISFN